MHDDVIMESWTLKEETPVNMMLKHHNIVFVVGYIRKIVTLGV